MKSLRIRMTTRLRDPLLITRRELTFSSFFLSVYLGRSFQVLIQIKCIVGGYPMIYHHMRRLSEFSEVLNVFLIGKYEDQKFNHFIEEIQAEFKFRSIQYIFDDVLKNDGGVFINHRNTILKDSPYIFESYVQRVLTGYEI